MRRCALLEDIKMLPAGDQTEIGEKVSRVLAAKNANLFAHRVEQRFGGVCEQRAQMAADCFICFFFRASISPADKSRELASRVQSTLMPTFICLTIRCQPLTRTWDFIYSRKYAPSSLTLCSHTTSLLLRQSIGRSSFTASFGQTLLASCRRFVFESTHYALKLKRLSDYRQRGNSQNENPSPGHAWNSLPSQS